MNKALDNRVWAVRKNKTSKVVFDLDLPDLSLTAGVFILKSTASGVSGPPV